MWKKYNCLLQQKAIYSPLVMQNNRRQEDDWAEKKLSAS